MARIVMKFGGTSMAGIERIRSVAARVKREVDAGNQVAVVVSAMAGETDRLVGFCREASALYDPREYDVVVASGEQVTSGLLAIALQAIGVPARSWLGWQLPIHTSDAHASARIGTIMPHSVRACFGPRVLVLADEERRRHHPTGQTHGHEDLQDEGKILPDVVG